MVHVVLHNYLAGRPRVKARDEQYRGFEIKKVGDEYQVYKEGTRVWNKGTRFLDLKNVKSTIDYYVDKNKTTPHYDASVLVQKPAREMTRTEIEAELAKGKSNGFGLPGGKVRYEALKTALREKESRGEDQRTRDAMVEIVQHNGKWWYEVPNDRTLRGPFNSRILAEREAELQGRSWASRSWLSARPVNRGGPAASRGPRTRDAMVEIVQGHRVRDAAASRTIGAELDSIQRNIVSAKSLLDASASRLTSLKRAKVRS